VKQTQTGGNLTAKGSDTDMARAKTFKSGPYPYKTSGGTESKQGGARTQNDGSQSGRLNTPA
jgi:hypothetical protein